MNIKINLPKFWRKLQWGGMAKELLLTFIGTTLSIVLTFGTAHYLEQKQLRADGRQTAMMVIHDMENSAESFEQYAKTEEERFKLTQYVIEHMDRLSTIPTDTLSAAYFYITQSSKIRLYKYDDSNEKLFLSDQDVWKNINNATFMDVAQHFFYIRRTCYESLNTDDVFIQPIPYDDLIDFCNTATTINFDYVAYLNKFLKRPQVAYYLRGFQHRLNQMSSSASYMRECAQRCKFIMDISDAELKDYLEQRKHGGRPIKKHQMVGTWIEQEDMDYSDVTEFKADNTLTSTFVYRVAHPYYVGRVDLLYIHQGTWDINGDSLLMCVNTNFDYSIDTSRIHILPGKEQEVQAYIAQWDKYLEEKQQQAQTDSVRRNSWAAYIDGSGQRIEAWRTNPDTGHESCSYLIKKED